MMIVMRRLIAVDGKVRTDINYPAGFMDVISVDKTNEQFRLLYDVKGRYVLHTIKPEEAGYKLCRVVSVSRANKATIGRNPFQQGQAGSVPYLTTHDGRTVRYPDPAIKKNDTIKFELKSGKIAGHVKFDIGNLAMITKGANVGRVGTIVHKDKHPGSFDIVHLKDKKGNTFATRASNVFIIGEANKSWITLPKAQGVKLSILEERAEKAEKARKDAEKAKRAAKKAANKQ